MKIFNRPHKATLAFLSRAITLAERLLFLSFFHCSFLSIQSLAEANSPIPINRQSSQLPTVAVTISQNFTEVLSTQEVVVANSTKPTALSALEQVAKVSTAYGGHFVSQINGLPASSYTGESFWFFYVNGIMASKGATAISLKATDRLRWDFHNAGTLDNNATLSALIGDFPRLVSSEFLDQTQPVQVYASNLLSTVDGSLVSVLKGMGSTETHSQPFKCFSPFAAGGRNIVIAPLSDLWPCAEFREVFNLGPKVGLFAEIVNRPSERAVNSLAMKTASFSITGLSFDTKRTQRLEGAGLLAALSPPYSSSLLVLITGTDFEATAAALRLLTERPPGFEKYAQILQTKESLHSLPLTSSQQLEQAHD